MAGTKAIKVFLDASVLVAASASLTGASAYILHLARERKIKALVSEDTIGEAVKNVNLKLGETGKRRLEVYLDKGRLNLVGNPEAETVAICEKVINSKDAPILAAAISAKADILLTLDRKHFLKILTPGDWLRAQRQTGSV